MRRTLVAILSIIATLATLANPHFAHGGFYDVYGLAPWWQLMGAFLDLAGLACGADLLWRRSAALALRVLLLEALLFLLITGASTLYAHGGYFSNGWGGNLIPAFAVALASRGLLLGMAYGAERAATASATRGRPPNQARCITLAPDEELCQTEAVAPQLGPPKSKMAAKLQCLAAIVASIS